MCATFVQIRDCQFSAQFTRFSIQPHVSDAIAPFGQCSSCRLGSYRGWHPLGRDRQQARGALHHDLAHGIGRGTNHRHAAEVSLLDTGTDVFRAGAGFAGAPAATSGKDLSHIDRAWAYAARHAALHAAQTGAGTCQVTIAYAPNRDGPLDVAYEMDRRGERLPPTWFAHSAVRQRYRGGPFVAALGTGRHFTDSALAWNHIVSDTPTRSEC